VRDNPAAGGTALHSPDPEPVEGLT